MNDSDGNIQVMVSERHRRMTPDERMHIAAALFDAARAIVDSSLPARLTPAERRLAAIRRFYAGELPESAMLAYAAYRRR